MKADHPSTITRRVAETLAPGSAEQDAGFRAEIARSSRISLLVIGGVQIGVSIFMVLARFLIQPDGSNLWFRLKQGAVVVGLGGLTIACSRTAALERWWRTIAIASGLLTATILIWAALLVLWHSPNPDDFIPGQITLVMLVAVTIVPLRPVHTFELGLAIGLVYLASTWIAYQRLGLGGGPDSNYLLFIVMLTLLCTGITAVTYQQRWANFELRETQARMLLAENATSLARLAAALSHELNNPMGAMLSGIDTMLLLTSRMATCDPQQQSRLVLLQSDVRKSIQQSAQRLKALVSRMQRFTNLDQAEVQNANLNELLADVAAMLEPQLPKTAKLEMDLQPLEPVVCRPQQISAVFSNLLSNAAQALNGDDGGRIVISSRQKPREVEIEVRDNGRGVDPSQLANIFEPTFKSTGTRVQSGNWSMFSSRQIIREHGGEIRVDSRPQTGTTVRVTLPVTAALT